MTMGAFFLIATVIGLATPIIPQIPFAIISAFFFSKGSPTIHLLIRGNPILGEAVCDWEDHGVVGRKMKIISIVSLILGACSGHWFLNPLWALTMDGIFAGTIIFLLTRRSDPVFSSGLRENSEE